MDDGEVQKKVKPRGSIGTSGEQALVVQPPRTARAFVGCSKAPWHLDRGWVSGAGRLKHSSKPRSGKFQLGRRTPLGRQMPLLWFALEPSPIGLCARRAEPLNREMLQNPF